MWKWLSVLHTEKALASKLDMWKWLSVLHTEKALASKLDDIDTDSTQVMKKSGNYRNKHALRICCVDLNDAMYVYIAGKH